MNNQLFDMDGEESAQTPAAVPGPMTDSQRSMIRDAFRALGVSSAKDQFARVEEMTGVRLTSVGALKQDTAQLVIYRLQDQVKNLARKNTGNSWDDRDEDTWIDKL
jgi:hypothetical protein